MQHNEIQAFGSTCPSLSNIANVQTTTLVDLTNGGCGPTGPRQVANTTTGSRCNQICSGFAQRQRGGVSGPVECRSGEWVNPANNLATGAIICGSVCPSVFSPTADPAQCVHTVANSTFNSAMTGTINDWYPMWKLYKGGEVVVVPMCAVDDAYMYSTLSVSATAMTLLEMEGRAIATPGSSGFLSLVGIMSVFALNEPLWASTFQITQFQTSASCILGLVS